MFATTARMRLGASVLFLCSLAPHAPAQAIVDERFAGGEIDAAWTVDVSAGNGVRVDGGALRIDADENTFAHVERLLDVDRVRVSCVLRPGNGISWCTSLFLYWGPGDWCQIGVIPRKGGRYYACVTSAGARAEHDLTRCVLDDWHDVAIELGADCVRFLARRGDGPWRTELALERPERLLGPPHLLVVGKGFGLDATTPDLDGDYGARGAAATSWVREVRVVPTAAERLRLAPGERDAARDARRDPLGRQVLAAGEPTFDRVAALLPALSQPREAVGVPEHSYEVGVEHDGTIQLPDDSPLWEQSGDVAYLTIGAPDARFGSEGCSKRLLGGYLPIVICSARVGGLACEETVLGYSAGMRVDADLVACVRLRVTNHDRFPRAVPIALHVVPRRGEPHTVPAVAHLGPGASATFCFEVPAPLSRPAVGSTPETFEARLVESAAAWGAWLGAGSQLAAPEARVTNAWRAWLAYALLDVDTVAGRLEPHDGAGFYEEVFGYSAVVFCNALDLWGRHEVSRRYLESLLERQRDDGLFFVRYGLPDHGAMLCALCEHFRLTGDAAWFRTVLPRVLRMCDWIVRTRVGPASAAMPPTRGLIRFLPYADHPRPTVDFCANAYCCVGLERVARALRELGEVERADQVARDAAAYRADILASMDAAVFERDGRSILPLEPDTRRILLASGGNAGGYYGLVASMLLETGFLAPDDGRAEWIRSFLQEENGLVLGMCEFDEGIDHAYTFGYWIDCLRRGEVDRVLLGFYGSLAYGMGRETFCGVEVTQILTGEPTPTTPHLYSSAQQLRLLRLMLLREEDGVLHVGQAIPSGWLAPGQRVVLESAPTSFGPLSVTYEASEERLIVTLQLPVRRSPERIRVYLGRGRAPVEVRSGGAPLPLATPNAVDLSSSGGRVRLEASFAR